MDFSYLFLSLFKVATKGTIYLPIPINWTDGSSEFKINKQQKKKKKKSGKFVHFMYGNILSKNRRKICASNIYLCMYRKM